MNPDLDESRAMIIPIVILIAGITLLIGMIFLTSSCTLNMIMTHTEGNASDVVDSNPSTEADVSPHLSVPVIP